ncbi:MAG: FAD-dependent oxidoreductase [Polyangiales bacterium]
MTGTVDTTRRAMLDVAVVGGGLCGLALARNLILRGRHVSVFEARPRLGGRIETTERSRHDLGAAWYWPDTQPLMRQLVRELGLRALPQHESGNLLVAAAPSDGVRAVALGQVGSAARRLEGGMTTLIDALAQDLPSDRVHLGHVLTAVIQKPRGVELHFLRDGKLEIITARRVVLALPPRLVAERVRFEPALNTSLRRTLLRTPTWMATEAKVVATYDAPSWRSAGHSGSAFVCHPDAVLDELFDACEPRSGLAALGGFVALSPAERGCLRAELPALISRQLREVFGDALHERDQSYRDWATELHTCSLRDRHEHGLRPERATYGAPELRYARWDDRLFLGGSETSEVEGGYLEGALHAAQRITRELTHLDTAPARPAIVSLRPALAHPRWDTLASLLSA